MSNKRKVVAELAETLDKWAQKTLPEEQQTLLRWLLSRGAYKERRVDGIHVEGTATYVFKTDIEQAVKDALAPLIKGRFPNPADGWPRMVHPIPWPRNGEPGWPRDGYPAIGMGEPPIVDPIKPDPIPTI
jgi:hypothetical protein